MYAPEQEEEDRPVVFDDEHNDGINNTQDDIDSEITDEDIDIYYNRPLRGTDLIEAESDEPSGPVPDIMSQYYKETAKHPLLQNWEIQKLSKQIEDGKYIQSLSKELEKELYNDPLPWQITERMVDKLVAHNKLINVISDTLKDKHNQAIAELVQIQQIKEYSNRNATLQDILNNPNLRYAIPNRLRYALQNIVLPYNPTIDEMGRTEVGLNNPYLPSSDITVSQMVDNKALRETLDGLKDDEFVNQVALKMNLPEDEVYNQMVDLSILSRVIYMGIIDKPHHTKIIDIKNDPNYLAKIQTYNTLLKQHLNYMDNTSKNAKEKFTNSNLRLAASIAKGYSNKDMDRMDIIQEANIGLMDAVDKFNYRKGYRFSTYAIWWIRQKVQRAIDDKGRSIRLPVYLTAMLNKISNVRNQLSQELGREPTTEEIAKVSEIEASKIEELRQKAQDAVSYNIPISDESDSGELSDIISDDDVVLPGSYEHADRLALKESMFEVLQTLNRTEYEIIADYYGIGDGREELTSDQIAEKRGITRQYVDKILNEALDKLRNPKRSEVLLDFLNRRGADDSYVENKAIRAQDTAPEKTADMVEILQQQENRREELERANEKAEELRKEREEKEKIAAEAAARIRENLRPSRPVHRSNVETHMFTEESFVEQLHNDANTEKIARENTRPTRPVVRTNTEDLQKSFFDKDFKVEEVEETEKTSEIEKEAQPSPEPQPRKEEDKSAPQSDIDQLDFWGMGNMNRRLPTIPKPDYSFDKNGRNKKTDTLG